MYCRYDISKNRIVRINKSHLIQGEGIAKSGVANKFNTALQNFLTASGSRADFAYITDISVDNEVSVQQLAKFPPAKENVRSLREPPAKENIRSLRDNSKPIHLFHTLNHSQLSYSRLFEESNKDEANIGGEGAVSCANFSQIR